MRCERPLIIGMILAVLGIFAHATWQASRRDDRGPTPPGGEGWRQTVTTQEDGSSEHLGRGVVSTSGDGESEVEFVQTRRDMVQHQLAARDISDRRVLDAMLRVPRHQFVPAAFVSRAYTDGPLPIGHGQTISQPYIVALMTQLARPHESAVALDVGTGSGYQAAVLAELCQRVYSIEIVEPLATSARERLAELGYQNVTVRHGDGYRGWPEHAPFDLIIVAAAPEKVPQPLIDQLTPGGRLVIPVGRRHQYQHLLVLEKQDDGSVRRETTIPVAFVPMTGEAEQRSN